MVPMKTVTSARFISPLVLATFRALTVSAFAVDKPDSAMLAPVNAVRDFMVTLDQRPVLHAFVPSGVVILEDFAPFIFQGRDAVLRWSTAFAHKSQSEKLTGLNVKFRQARNFTRTGDRVFFVLPTTWTGREKKRFIETGAWSFVLQRLDSEWKIKGYAWEVTSFKYLD